MRGKWRALVALILFSLVSFTAWRAFAETQKELQERIVKEGREKSDKQKEHQKSITDAADKRSREWTEKQKSAAEERRKAVAAALEERYKKKGGGKKKTNLGAGGVGTEYYDPSGDRVGTVTERGGAVVDATKKETKSSGGAACK